MKILHTADWHIGKRLKKQSLNHELKLFFEWLANELTHEKYDLLLVSGDIFDSYNPKTEDRALYYQTLTLLTQSVGQIIITGGNHDSIAVLNAAKPLLKPLNISVIGGASDQLIDELIPVTTKSGEACVIAAIPFLRDRDVLQNQTFDSDQDKPSQIREGYANHYQSIYHLANEHYPNLPLIGMGHLYATGAKLSESERDIQVGNQGAVSGSIFEGYDYMALGHIHRPQRVNNLDTVRYSGSPIALSFSEKSDNKQVVKITLTDNKVESIVGIELPQFRQLSTIDGSYDEVKKILSQFESTCPLQAFIEVNIHESVKDISLIPLIEQTIEQFNKTSTQGKILKHKITFEGEESSHESLFIASKQIDDLTHLEVFNEVLELQSQDPESRKSLIATYTELSENYQDYLDETA